MLFSRNNCLIVFMLTSNRSLFFETGGSVGCFYQCQKFKFLLKGLDQRYDRIPIHYNDRNIFVDHNTRQRYTANSEVNFVGVCKDAHQLDINSDDSWYQLRPAIVL